MLSRKVPLLLKKLPPLGSQKNALKLWKFNVLEILKKQWSLVRMHSKQKGPILLLISNARRIFWQIRSIAGHASAPRQKRKDGMWSAADWKHWWAYSSTEHFIFRSYCFWEILETIELCFSNYKVSTQFNSIVEIIMMIYWISGWKSSSKINSLLEKNGSFHCCLLFLAFMFFIESAPIVGNRLLWISPSFFLFFEGGLSIWSRILPAISFSICPTKESFSILSACFLKNASILDAFLSMFLLEAECYFLVFVISSRLAARPF